MVIDGDDDVITLDVDMREMASLFSDESNDTNSTKSGEVEESEVDVDVVEEGQVVDVDDVLPCLSHFAYFLERPHKLRRIRRFLAHVYEHRCLSLLLIYDEEIFHQVVWWIRQITVT